jgi:hypothetical protein
MSESPESRKSGYTYWKRDIPDAHLLPSSEPQMISHSSSEENIANTRTSSSGLVSAWNAGTTYEEKDITERAKKVLTELVSQRSVEGVGLEVKKIKGEIHAVHARGKVRIGYEIETLELSTDDGKTIEIDDLDSTDPEGFSVNQAGGLNKAKVKTFVVELMSDLSGKLLTD